MGQLLVVAHQTAYELSLCYELELIPDPRGRSLMADMHLVDLGSVVVSYGVGMSSQRNLLATRRLIPDPVYGCQLPVFHRVEIWVPRNDNRIWDQYLLIPGRDPCRPISARPGISKLDKET